MSIAGELKHTYGVRFGVYPPLYLGTDSKHGARGFGRGGFERASLASPQQHKPFHIPRYATG